MRTLNCFSAASFAFALLASSLAAAEKWITYPAKPGVGEGRRLVFLTGDEEYRGEEGLPMLAKILSQRFGFHCTVLFPIDPDGTINPDNNQSVPGIEQLDTADGIVMMLRFRQWPDAAMRHLASAIDRGVPIVGLRTSTHAFRFPADSPSSYKHFNDFGRNVLGENWVSHWGANRRGATRSIIEPGAASHPILRGVGEIYGDSGVYETHPVADAQVVMRGLVLKSMDPRAEPDSYRKMRKADGIEQPINEPAMPLAWTRLHQPPSGRPNRIFCTTLGAATDLADENLRRLVVNAVLWGFAFPIPARANVAYIDPYSPTPYAFKGYRRGITPADHAIGKTLPEGTTTPPAVRNK